MERRAIAIQGIVQGVGFRPFVHGLATRLALNGFVRNRSGGVWIEVEGERGSLDSFLAELQTHPPPLAQIARLDWETQPPRGDQHFHIETSQVDAGPVFIGPDVATCDACLQELFSPKDRRYRYPFLNCTRCGPRLTIIRGVPYDRVQTTMSVFPMCPACQREYDDPADRRFHAQPTACAGCGPSLELRDSRGERMDVADPLTAFARELCDGKIGAVKGLGGYHLVCDASNAAAVTELRRRKHREEKPFAVMVRDAAAAKRLCSVNEGERKLLQSPRRPIVLLHRRPTATVAKGIAPGNPFLGIMLPYTPVHHLLLEACGDRPLVMTSGNRSDEPIAYEDDDALERLSGIADVFLLHNRRIHVRCDDSVTRWVDGSELPLRRSRGYAPQPITLPFTCPRPILAVGGQLKGTFAVGRDRHAFLSHHLGDLDHYEAYRAFERDVGLYEKLFAVEPAAIAHDLHPDYATTRYAESRSGAAGEVMFDGTRIACFGVQHHHAHMASVIAEHGIAEAVIGVTFDGTGHGTDGAAWGGEFLTGDCRNFVRAGHLRYVGMPGGDQAVREPWRMALAHAAAAGGAVPGLEGRIDRPSWHIVSQMVQRGLRTPPTSSMGRLFDAVAALAGVRDRVRFEGQAAIELEWLAGECEPDTGYPFDLTGEEPIQIDPRPLIRAVIQDIDKGIAVSRIARRFHTTVVNMIVAVCKKIRQRTGLDTVVLSGGVFHNVLLTRESCTQLETEGFRVYRHEKVPPGDGGLCLGQLAVAAARMSLGGTP
jgi:hydrogenase maturation protein HypF